VEFVGDKYKQQSCLAFNYTFEYENDTVFFAHFAPYTYTDLENLLLKYSKEENAKDILRIDGLCHSLAGNVCYCLTITNNI
jgi:hypothetical protein